MKKVLIIALAAFLAAAMCVHASAEVVNSNHYIDSQGFNSDESEWEVLGWTVVDTEIVRLGYVLDGTDPVWVVDTIDVRSDNSVIKRNDCFEDRELEAAVASGGMANGLTAFFGYRIHITLDTKAMEKGDHMIEIAAEYSDGSFGNPFRGNAVEFVKTADAVIPEESSDPEEPGDLTNGDLNGDGSVDNKDVVTLFRYVSTNTEDADLKYDFNGDGEVDNKDVVSLFRAVSAN